MKKYLILVLIFNNYISFSQEEFGFSAASLAGIENNWIDSADCIYGNCYDGFGMLSNGDNFYFGEFENGKFNGLGFKSTDGKNNVLSRFKNGEANGLVHGFTKSSDLTYFRRNNENKINGTAVRTSNNRFSILEFDNNKLKRVIQRLNPQVESFKSYQTFNVYAPIGTINSVSAGVLRRELPKRIKTKDIYNSELLSAKSDFDIIIGDFASKFSINGNTVLGIKRDFYFIYAIYYLGEVYGSRFEGNGIYVVVKDGEIIDLSFQSTGAIDKTENYRISRTLENEFIEYKYKKSQFNSDEYVFQGSPVSTNIKAPPNLAVSDIDFIDGNNNNLIEADESSNISFRLTNNGEGAAYGIRINLVDKNNINGLDYDKNKYINYIDSGGIQFVNLSLRSSMELDSGEANLHINITERNGFNYTDKITFNIETQKFISPYIEVTDFQYISKSGKINKGNTSTLQFIVQNTGQGIAENIDVRLKIPNNTFAFDDTNYTIDKLDPGESRQFDLKFATNNRYSNSNLEIVSNISEKYNKYGSSKIMNISIGQDVSNNIAFDPEVTIDRSRKEIQRKSLVSDVDRNIPTNSKVNNRYALIIGNEDYSSYQNTLSSEQNVDYAVNDAIIFKNYALNTLGVKQENMRFLTNATSGQMSREIELVNKIVKKIGDEAELIVYYAGHGYPDNETKIPYLIPVDVSASNLDSAIKLDDFYASLASTNARKVTVFLDACFTGGGRNVGLFASRGVRVRPKTGVLSGNLVVFSASTADQSSLPYHNERHGMFTYHLLKKLQETKGNVTLGELSNYLEEQVSLQSLKINQTDQEPSVNVSNQASNQWRNWKF